MSYVPSQSLSSLICANCNRYLSHFPIYFSPGKGSICGRCPLTYDSDTVRNVVYEHIAQSQKFPCCYDVNGCTENLVPSKIPQHEKHCSYMKSLCPISCSTDCKWQGFTKDITEHVEQKHPTFFLKDGMFELDFVSSYSENCILPFGEDLFIVTRSNDSKTNTFSCALSYIGTNPLSASYAYKMMLENERKSHAHAITNNLDVKTDINIEGVKYILNDPSSIVATIEILEQKPPEARDDASIIDLQDEQEEEGNSAINYELMKELECTVCLEYMLPPIYQCLTGHSICSRCKESLEKCPSCQAEFKNTQNFTLAQVINHLIYPCKHRRCKFATKAKDIRQHEATCIYGPFKCPLEEYEDCHVETIFSEIYDHIVEHHYENLLEMETVTVPFESGEDEEDEDCFIIKYGFRLFKLHHKYQGRTFKWAMQLIGPAEESCKYMFEIDVVDNSGKNRRAYFRSVCSGLSDNNAAFDGDRSFIMIPYDQISSMITKDFSYRVRVLHD